MRIWNTLSGKKEELKKTEGQPLHLFVCGPTVYDYSHLGHARTYIVYDVFVRYLRHKDWPVFYLQNITDIDDKIIARAKAENKKPLALASFFTRVHFEDMRALGIDTVTKYAPASRFIPQIERQVRTLIEKGYAYEIPDDGIYFDITKFKDYGKLSHRTTLQAEDAISRIDESVKKRNKGDFVLWKFSKTPVAETLINRIRHFAYTADGEPSWKIKLGWGRPGWHIEDTAITDSYFGSQYDIHGGAVELKFPHHEAEIAQQEAASGKSPLVKIWMHTGVLTVSGEKMSKSLGNFITIRDFLKKRSSGLLRWFLLSHHYRTPIDYTSETLAQTEAITERVRVFFEKLAFVEIKGNENKKDRSIRERIQKTEEEFENALNDDFNTPAAIASVLNLINDFQEKVWGIGSADAKTLRKYLEKTLKIFGVGFARKAAPRSVRKIARERELCRARQQFTQADALREKIRVLGYSIEDTPQGPFIYKEQ